MNDSRTSFEKSAGRLRSLSLYALLVPAVLAMVTTCGCRGCFGGQPAAGGSAVGVEAYAKDITRAGGKMRIELDFTGSGMTDEGLAGVEFPAAVRVISLAGTDITDKGLNELRRAENLERVNLSGTKITDAGVEFLKTLPKLWRVNANATNVSPKKRRDLSLWCTQRAQAREAARLKNRKKGRGKK